MSKGNRKMRKITFLIAAAALFVGLTALATTRSDTDQLALAAPASPQTATSAAAANPVVISENDNGKTITVTEGSDVTIQLAGNITTGHSWSVTSASGKSAKQDGAVTYKSDQSTKLGHGGVFTAKFTTATAGSTTVKMEYKQPWNKNTAPAKTFSVTIRVVPLLKKP